MRIAFYAPLKPPDHSVASGDRTVARSLVAALRMAGHQVQVASRFRTFDKGSEERQQRLEALGSRLAKRLVARYAGDANRPDLWFTYHLYHKAPDWLGPPVAAMLGIPYAVAEASFAPKQDDGPWGRGHRSVEAALKQARRVFALNPADIECIRPLLGSRHTLVPLPPFLDAAWFSGERRSASQLTPPDPADAGRKPVRLLTVAMMRHDQKLQSYRLLTEAMARLLDVDWHLTVVGYGPAETEVRAALALLGNRVTWIGEVTPTDIRDLYGSADIVLWPSIKEAWGMVLLEAQASGTPVIAGRSGGVPSVVDDGVTGLIVPMGDATAFAAAARTLIIDQERRKAMGRAAQAFIRERHDLPVAAAILDRELRAALVEARA